MNHQGQFPVVTISFNLAPGASLGDAVKAIEQAEKETRTCRPAFTPTFRGRPQAFQASLANEPCLILAALITVYIVLGVLVRELHSSDHDSLDAAVGGRGRDSGAAVLQNGSQRHRADRNHSADRHREEERDHDDRLRAGGGAATRASRRKRRFTRRACCASVRS